MLSIHLVLIVCTLKVVNTLTRCDFIKFEKGCDKETNTVCDNLNETCICKPGYSIKLETICLQSVNIDGECTISLECSHIPNAQCVTVEGFELRYNQFHNFGARIWHSLRKLVEDEREVNGFCKCKKGYQYDIVKNECIYKVIGSACRDHSDCSKSVSNSECHSRVCNCQITHYHFNDSCLLKKNFDDFCSNDFECKSNLYCGEGSQCKCRENYEFNEQSSKCQYKFFNEANGLAASNTGRRLWDDIVKVGGFVIIVVVMLFLCTKKETEQNETLNNNASTRRRSTSFTRAHRRRSSSVNSHRPLTQTSSNASRTSAYRTFEESKQTTAILKPVQVVRSPSSSDDEIEYNPYLFDSLFPQQSDNDDPPSYEEVVKEMGNH